MKKTPFIQHFAKWASIYSRKKVDEEPFWIFPTLSSIDLVVCCVHGIQWESLHQAMSAVIFLEAGKTTSKKQKQKMMHNPPPWFGKSAPSWLLICITHSTDSWDNTRWMDGCLNAEVGSFVQLYHIIFAKWNHSGYKYNVQMYRQRENAAF